MDNLNILFVQKDDKKSSNFKFFVSLPL